MTIPSFVDAFAPGWAQSAGLHWQISTVSPDEGVKHARLNEFSVAGNGPHLLYPVAGIPISRCDLGGGNIYSAIVQWGDLIELRGKWRHVGLTSGGPPKLTYAFDLYDVDCTLVDGFVSAEFDLTSSYTEYLMTIVAPVSSRYLLGSGGINYNTPNSTCQADADSFVLTIL